MSRFAVVEITDMETGRLRITSTPHFGVHRQLVKYNEKGTPSRSIQIKHWKMLYRDTNRTNQFVEWQHCDY
jgi:hypothetical protein